jgi:hypothetical protein
MSDPSPFIFPQVIDATMRSDWRACPHRFFRRHVQGLVAPGEVSVHLHFGGCLAKGLETARREFFVGGSPDRALFNGCEAIIAAWGDFQGKPAPNVNEKKKSLEACILSLAEYFKTWPLESDDVTIHVHRGEPCIEFSFAVPIPGSRHPVTGDPILYAGRFDLIGDYLKAVWGLDDKTATSMSSAEKWRLRGQFTGYCWGSREYGVSLAGFLVREVQILTHEIRCQQVQSIRPDWMIDAWQRQLQQDVNDMCVQWDHLSSGRWTEAAGFAHPFPQAFDNACHDFNHPCAFVDLCSSEHPDRWLDNFDVRRWDPLTRTED